MFNFTTDMHCFLSSRLDTLLDCDILVQRWKQKAPQLQKTIMHTNGTRMHCPFFITASRVSRDACCVLGGIFNKVGTFKMPEVSKQLILFTIV
jgi:hypothetical protein